MILFWFWVFIGIGGVGCAFTDPYHKEDGKKVKDAPAFKWILLFGWIILLIFLGSQGV